MIKTRENGVGGPQGAFDASAATCPTYGSRDAHNAAGGLLAQWLLLGQATKDARLSRSDLAVLHSIADRIGDNGKAWPSMTRIAADVGVDPRTATRSIKRLVETGYLVRQSGNRTTSNVYRLGTGEAAGTGEFTGTGEAAGEVPASSSGRYRRVRPSNPPSESTHEVAHTKARTRAERAQLPEPPTWVPREAWDGYVEMRKRKRSTLTPRACELVFKQLERFQANGHDPGDVLDRSTAAGWTGVFEPRVDQQNKTANAGGGFQARASREEQAREAGRRVSQNWLAKQEAADFAEGGGSLFASRPASNVIESTATVIKAGTAER